MELWDPFAPWDFSPALALFLLSVPLFLLFVMEMFTLCNCILKICNLLFIFIGAHSQEFALSLRDFSLGLLDIAIIVKTETLRGELKAFCLMR